MYLGILKETIKFNLFHVVVLPSALFYFLTDCCKIFVLKKGFNITFIYKCTEIEEEKCSLDYLGPINGLGLFGP